MAVSVPRWHRADVRPLHPERRLQVVYLDHVARLSGAEIALLRVLPALARDVDAHIILGEEGPLVDRLQRAGISTEVMPLPQRLREVRKDTVKLRKIDRQALSSVPGYVKRLSRRIRELDVDIVHTNSLKAALYGGVAARAAHVPVVWHVRDRITSDYLPVPAVALVRATSLMLPSAIVTNSRATLMTLPRHARNRPINEPIVIHDAVEQPPTSPCRATPPVTIGILGRLAPWKGQEVFIRAFAEAFAGTDVKGRIIGSAMFGEDEYGRRLESLVEELRLSSQIEFRGFREDVWDELAALDVLVHCSTTPEPFGQVVLEGLASGVAVVAAAAGGPTEVITDGVDGILTSPGDVQALAATLRRLHDDEGYRLQLAAAGRRRSRDFTPERGAEQLLTVYRRLVAARER